MATREVVWTERHRAPVSSGAQATGFTPLVPEIQNLDRAPAVWVFQLP